MKKRIFAALAAVCTLAAGAMLFAGCGGAPNLKDYVSEYRSNLYEGSEGEYSVFATFSTREYPYLADGNVGDMTTLFEVALTAADNTKTYEAVFTSNGTQYTAQLNFDSVRMAHTWSQSIPEPQETELVFTVRDADDAEDAGVAVTAASKRGADVLPLDALLEKASAAEPERFNALTDGKLFAGELYVRLLAGDEGCLYYIGLTDRGGKTFAMLADAQTGTILATHED